MFKPKLQKAASAIISLLICFSLFSCSSHKNKEGSFADNWETDSVRYLKSGSLKKDSHGDNITFSEESDGSIKVKAGKGSGYMPLSLLTSKNTTPLDGLSVTIMPDEMDFTLDEMIRSQVISIMWTQDPIQTIDESLAHFDFTATNGIRNSAEPTKGLCITLNNSYSVNDGTKTASNLMITLINGDFHDAIDHRLGYRWSFTARNFLSQSPNGDDTKIVSKYANIDISEGLTVSVKKDDMHGYIVNINGIDYYSSNSIAYYPNNTSDMYDLNSMTSKKEDINLNPLLSCEKGYLSIGVCGSLNDPGLTYTYRVTDINGTPAAYWNGK